MFYQAIDVMFRFQLRLDCRYKKDDTPIALNILPRDDHDGAFHNVRYLFFDLDEMSVKDSPLLPLTYYADNTEDVTQFSEFLQNQYPKRKVVDLTLGGHSEGRTLQLGKCDCLKRDCDKQGTDH